MSLSSENLGLLKHQKSDAIHPSTALYHDTETQAHTSQASL